MANLEKGKEGKENNESPFRVVAGREAMRQEREERERSEGEESLNIVKRDCLLVIKALEGEKDVFARLKIREIKDSLAAVYRNIGELSRKLENDGAAEILRGESVSVAGKKMEVPNDRLDRDIEHFLNNFAMMDLGNLKRIAEGRRTSLREEDLAEECAGMVSITRDWLDIFDKNFKH